jgi:hypothetical protein
VVSGTPRHHLALASTWSLADGGSARRNSACLGSAVPSRRI